LLIIDEASMTATKDLDHITAVAAKAGAKVLLVGDWAQLSPVQAGGAFKLLAQARGDEVPTLRDVRRFRHEWEGPATLRLRLGDTTVAQTYIAQGRVEAGAREDMLDLLLDGWLTDARAGRYSLMLAGDAETVSALNARARAHRVGAGEVAAAGVQLEDGTTVGVGDVIVTRLNMRALVTTRGWVKNGDDWIVTAVAEDGSVQVDRPGGGAVAVLPGDYVRDHVELGYASTAHRAQGRTVDTAHAYIAHSGTRESLYVMATRGRDSNRLYVDTTCDSDASTDHGATADLDPLDVLRGVVATSTADTAATEVRRLEHVAAKHALAEAAERQDWTGPTIRH
jgi:ATP-dependent exoDNAse (exonuclease V) alpha subunit